MRSVFKASMLLAATLLAGCATTGGQRLAEKDPLENFNRGVWGFNMALDKAAVKPITKTYKAVTPTAARRGVRNVFNNAYEPLSFFNALLQGKVGRAFHTLGRFVINTTIGVGGLADHATGMGLEEKPEDLGQTLATWGVNAGPYLVLPLIGPFTLRDSVGFGVEIFADPTRIALKEYSGLTRTQRYGVTGLEVIDLRAELMEMGADKVLETSLDPYATARAAYLQRRQSLILNQEGSSSNDSPQPDAADFDIGVDEGAPALPAAPENVDPRDFDIPDDMTSPAGHQSSSGTPSDEALKKITPQQ